MEGIEIIRYNPMLQKAFKYIIEKSKSNYLPYHNLNHLLTVLKYADKIAHGEEVYYDKRLPLHLAALFHDVNHSGGKLKDDENIANAIFAFEDFAAEYMDLADNNDVKVMDEAILLIQATEFPYVKPNSITNHFEKIIRDADMMQAFENNWINQTTLGLASESNTPIKDFIPKQRNFLESITFITKTANKIKEERWSEVMNQFRILEVSVGVGF